MAKKKKQKAGVNVALAKMKAKLEDLEYSEVVESLELLAIDPDEIKTCPLAACDGEDVVVFCWPVDAGLSQQVAIQDDGVFWSRLIGDGRIAHFVWVSDGDVDYFFDNQRNTSIAELPQKADWRNVVRGMTDDRKKKLIEVSTEYARGNWRQVQRQFDELHEKLYPKGGITTANDAIDEICRLMFLKIHLERHPGYIIKQVKKRLSDVLNSQYIESEKKGAVQELKATFKEIAALPEYQTSDQFGESHGIFPEDDYLRLDRPDILAFAAEILEDMPRLVVDKIGNGDKRVREDLLGWAYDVFLRGKYESSGGLATYLTPGEVTEAMTIMVLHDVTNEELWEGFQGINDKSIPTFIMGDFTCGTGRFLMKYLDKVRERIWNTVGKGPKEKEFWFHRIVEHGVIGADQAKESLIKARLNMILYGGIHTKLWTVEDSITDSHVDSYMGKVSLIMTNPPFGSGKYTDKIGLQKLRSDKTLYEKNIRDLLDDPKYRCELGWKWSNGDRNKKKKLTKADPATLFIDRNLQLLKPGGRLLIVLPDGVLSNSSDRYIREYLMGIKDEESGKFFGGKSIIKAVVSLPMQTFSITGTGAKTSFLYIQKKGTYKVVDKSTTIDRQGTIFMAVANHVGYIKKGNSEQPDPKGNDLTEIVSVYQKGL